MTVTHFQMEYAGSRSLLSYKYTQSLASTLNTGLHGVQLLITAHASLQIYRSISQETSVVYVCFIVRFDSKSKDVLVIMSATSTSDYTFNLRQNCADTTFRFI